MIGVFTSWSEWLAYEEHPINIGSRLPRSVVNYVVTKILKSKDELFTIVTLSITIILSLIFCIRRFRPPAFRIVKPFTGSLLIR